MFTIHLHCATHRHDRLLAVHQAFHVRHRSIHSVEHPYMKWDTKNKIDQSRALKLHLIESIIRIKLELF